MSKHRARFALPSVSFEAYCRAFPDYLEENRKIKADGFCSLRSVGRFRLRDGRISYIMTYRRRLAGETRHLTVTRLSRKAVR